MQGPRWSNSASVKFGNMELRGSDESALSARGGGVNHSSWMPAWSRMGIEGEEMATPLCWLWKQLMELLVLCSWITSSGWSKAESQTAQAFRMETSLPHEHKKVLWCVKLHISTSISIRSNAVSCLSLIRSTFKTALNWFCCILLSTKQRLVVYQSKLIRCTHRPLY